MYLNSLPEYKDKGLVITPLLGKRPFVKNWENTNTETILTDDFYLTQNGKKIPLKKANIGLLCGEPSGVVCIDIDTFDEDIEQIILNSLPETPVMKKGKKGVNFFYRFNGEATVNYKNPLTKRDNLFELISTGRQTVLPPSIHPDTKEPYEWCDKEGNPAPHTLTNTDLDSLPTLPKNWLRDLDLQIRSYFQNKETTNSSGGVADLLTGDDTGQSHKNMNDYAPKTLDEIPEGYRDRSRSGAHNAMSERMMGMINGRVDAAKCVEEILKFDKEYNTGYPSTYYECRTCKFGSGSPEQRAKAHYADLFATVTRKKIHDGEEIPFPVAGKESSGSGIKELDVVQSLLVGFGVTYRDEDLIEVEDADMVYYEGDLFRYTGEGYWIMLDDADIRRIKRIIARSFAGKASNNKIESTYKMFLTYLPGAPEGVNLHQGNPYTQCFNNCTLHIIETESGYELKDYPHNKLDYCTSKIELDYDPEYKESNDHFSAMLDRVFLDDSDKEDKIRAIQEFYGASIMPVFPKIFFLHGKAGSGKSTLFTTLSNLLRKDNIGRVDPSDFRGFLLEPLIGKMVNLVTDIKSNTPIEASVLKQIEDRVDYTIQRKGKKNICSPLPAVHGFGANDLPKNFDSNAKAFNRRVVFIKFNNIVVKEDGNGNYAHDRNFGHRAFRHNPQGILNFALQGLERICKNNGQYTQPKSGVDTMNQWQSEYNVYDQFVLDIEASEVSGIGSDVPCLKEDGTFLRKGIWEIFKKWLQESNRGKQNITKQAFYKDFDNRFLKVHVNGYVHYKGIGSVIPENSTQGVDGSGSPEINQNF